MNRILTTILAVAIVALSSCKKEENVQPKTVQTPAQVTRIMNVVFISDNPVYTLCEVKVNNVPKVPPINVTPGDNVNIEIKTVLNIRCQLKVTLDGNIKYINELI